MKVWPSLGQKGNCGENNQSCLINSKRSFAGCSGAVSIQSAILPNYFRYPGQLFIERFPEGNNVRLNHRTATLTRISLGAATAGVKMTGNNTSAAKLPCKESGLVESIYIGAALEQLAVGRRKEYCFLSI